jgi:Ca-activated chloride channel family protein
MNRLSPRPRLYAIAAGEEPRLELLSGLAAPAGFAAHVARRGDVARTAMDLLAHVSRPLVRNVRVELGPQVQAVYPAEPVDLPAGEPLVVIGRYLTELPREITVRALWNGTEVSARRPLSVSTVTDDGDLRMRWATLRLEHLLARGESRPVIVELGTRFGLITPFTSLYVPSENEISALSPRPSQRFAAWNVFDLLPLVGCSRHSPESAPARSVAPAAPAFEPGAPESAQQAPSDNAPPMAAAPATGSAPPPPPSAPARVAGRANAASALSTSTEFASLTGAAEQPAGGNIDRQRGPQGEPSIAPADEADGEGDALRAGILGAMGGGGGGESTGGLGTLGHGTGRGYGGGARREERTRSTTRLRAAHDIPPAVPRNETGEDTAPSRCSDAASVSLAERLPLWRERLLRPGSSLQVYRRARQTCELPQWADRVALLRLMAARAGRLEEQIALYRGLGFDPAARAWMRDQILRTLARTGELARAQELGLGRLDPDTIVAALGHAATPAQRLAVLRELTRRYPDDLDLALRLLDTAVSQRSEPEVRTTAARLRAHPQADARMRTAAGEALLSIGEEAEARRAFSEIVEFAPDDPLARRRLGDLALAHGWADEAYRQFQMLAQLEDDAPDVLLRQAMAARLAGRVDEAIRLAERVAEQSVAGGSNAGDIAAAWIAIELALLAKEPGVSPETLTALQSRWRRSPAARTAGAVRVVLRWQHPDDGAELWLTLPGEGPRRSDTIAESIFFESTVLAEAPASLGLEVRRSSAGRPDARVEVLVIWHEGTAEERIQRRTLALDTEHDRYVLAASPEALTDTTPPAARALALAPTGGAR